MGYQVAVRVVRIIEKGTEHSEPSGDITPEPRDRDKHEGRIATPIVETILRILPPDHVIIMRGIDQYRAKTRSPRKKKGQAQLVAQSNAVTSVNSEYSESSDATETSDG